MLVIPATKEAEIQEDQGLTAWANSSRDPISKKAITKKGWWLKVYTLSSNSSTAKKKKKKETT
jgi:hypothetical protein